jgi:hypothetical protein
MSESLQEALSNSVVTVIFTKKDGTDRTMKCTTMESIIPVQYHPKNTGRAKNQDVQNVFDVELKEWRSFRLNSVKQFYIEV